MELKQGKAGLIFACLYPFIYMRNRSLIPLTVVAILIKLFSLFPLLVEHWYSTGIFPLIAQSLRVLFGWVPVSVGDILYTLTGIYLAWNIYRFIRELIRKQVTRKGLMQLGQRMLAVILVVYIAFNLLWGLNYNRIPMTTQLGLKLSPYTTQNLQVVATVLIGKLNAFDSTDKQPMMQLNEERTLFRKSVQTYALTKNSYPLLTYKAASIKPSLFSYAGNYIGFTGYYNPFTGEAQVNTTVPVFVQPFTACHEMGHQLGYAKENEANFAGFLSCRLSADPAFRYSVYFDMYAYVFSEMNRRDSVAAKSFNEQLHHNVRVDYKMLRVFFRRYENPFGDVIWKLYAHYLRANQQPSGLDSYNEVVAMLIAFYRKYGFV